MEIISAIFADIRAIDGLFTDCRIMDLIVVIKDLSTDEGVQKILIRISEHFPEVLSQIGEMVIAITQSDMNGAGKYLGEILKIILEFYVN